MADSTVKGSQHSGITGKGKENPKDVDKGSQNSDSSVERGPEYSDGKAKGSQNSGKDGHDGNPSNPNNELSNS